MTTNGHGGAATGTSPSPHGSDMSQPIKAVRLRHPWRTVIAIILIVYLVAFVWDAAQRSAFQWDVFGKYLFDQRISAAAVNTILLTVYSMIIAAVLALILAVMRLSDNPVFKSVAWFYLWIFRGTPVYVQLVFWGLLSVIYPTLIDRTPVRSAAHRPADAGDPQLLHPRRHRARPERGRVPR